MTDPADFTPRTDRPKVVITDYDFGNVDVETGILEAAGAEVIALQAKAQEDLFDVAPHCAAMMNQYARIGKETITRMQKCEVIARYGVGVDIVTSSPDGHFLVIGDQGGRLHFYDTHSQLKLFSKVRKQQCMPGPCFIIKMLSHFIDMVN